MSIREHRSAHRRKPGWAAPSDPGVRDRTLPDRGWNVLPAGSRAFRFPAPSGALAAFAVGDPGHPRVVLLPGATGSKEDFVLLGPLLADTGFLVESYDLAGQYQSAAAGPVDGSPYEYGLFVADLIAFLAAGSTPVHVLGYSFAGIVAELAFADRPELFGSLVLLGVPPQSGQAFRRVRWIGALSYVLRPRQIASLIVWGIVSNLNRVPPGRLALVRLRFAYTNRRSVDEIVGLLMHVPDLSALLRHSAIPVLVAVGHHDLWSTDVHRAFANSIGARFRVYPTGHSPCETTPHQLARDMLALYRSAEPG
ncbi:alpha/beta hydrolase [Cryobacterium sp. TmT2-59]|uniref:alpha/beta fold hydrolase n=1 Tax=Cryobacterium sp. TmT2-59 TaxID=1259264 RepID=UPI00106CA49B|nr:alpha/beta hydrolase [Cryobacterium sp. TmT2-59]TFC85205.1 alpha/beta hydrolase [Cryobacterium sp. TmT2-59]